MKEIDNWVEQFKKIWEFKFNQLDNLVAIIKRQKKVEQSEIPKYGKQ